MILGKDVCYVRGEVWKTTELSSTLPDGLMKIGRGGAQTASCPASSDVLSGIETKAS